MIVARAQLAIWLGPLGEINSRDRGGAGGGSIDGAPARQLYSSLKARWKLSRIGCVM
jgi:hypothetical protein